MKKAVLILMFALPQFIMNSVWAGNVFEDFANVITIGQYHKNVKKARAEANKKAVAAEKKAQQEIKNKMKKVFYDQAIKYKKSAVRSADQYMSLKEINDFHEQLIAIANKELQNKMELSTTINGINENSEQQIQMYEELSNFLEAKGLLLITEQKKLMIENWKASLDTLSKVAQHYNANVNELLEKGVKKADPTELEFIINKVYDIKKALVLVMMNEQSNILNYSMSYNESWKKAKNYGAKENFKELPCCEVDVLIEAILTLN